ncbi:helicase-primase subunit [Chimpanzee herpesvirus strain 105640]|uniref:Helicase-primase subunit n=1 Tax=Chimpanzee herpesvirus strain 105640 TaxID=332937 RepID=K9MEV8_9ALPH|nr:helicase-primase subunit [Chimpanzee herpesvirus strain 105640]AFV26896.1 helicase-primase subunit [Chimpanzee herpesvirus strain 105640]
MEAPGLVWAEESVSAITLYAVWLPPRTRDCLHALLYLVCRDVAGEAHARFAEVSVSSSDLQDFYGSPDVSAAGAVAAARAATAPATSPLEPLGDPTLWRALYACVLAALERQTGPVALFVPLRLGWDPHTGLVVRVERASWGPPAVPRAALLDVEANVDVDPLALTARVAEHPGARLAWARLAAIRDSPQCASSASLTVTITTGTARFVREYTTLAFPPTKKEGAFADLVEVCEVGLRPRGHPQRVTARVLLPRGYDYFVSAGDRFSAPALVALFRQWHTTVHAAPGALAPVFAFLGPGFEVRGGPVQYFAVLGFPGWPTFPVPATAESARDLVRGAAATHAACLGAWPAVGARVVLPPRAWPVVASEAASRLLPAFQEAVARWHPTATTIQLLDPPSAVGPVWTARFCFSGLQDQLLSALAVLGEAGLPEARGRAGLERLNALVAAAPSEPWARAVLERLVPDACDACPALRQLLGGVMAAVCLQIEKTASSVKFAVCGGAGGAFWGLFNVDPGDADAAYGAIQDARRALEASVRTVLLASDIRPPHAPSLALEGVYTHVVTWSQTGVWFWNSRDDTDFLQGFPLRGPAYTAAAAVIRDTLRRILRQPAAGPQEEAVCAVRGLMEDACDRFVVDAFGRRLDAEYWSVLIPPCEADEPLPQTAFRGGALLDAEQYWRRVVRVCPGGGESIGVPVDLYPRPLVLPPVDCAHHLREILREIQLVFTGLLEGMWGEGGSFVYPFEEKMRFLFA